MQMQTYAVRRRGAVLFRQVEGLLPWLGLYPTAARFIAQLARLLLFSNSALIWEPFFCVVRTYVDLAPVPMYLDTGDANPAVAASLVFEHSRFPEAS